MKQNQKENYIDESEEVEEEEEFTQPKRWWKWPLRFLYSLILIALISYIVLRVYCTKSFFYVTVDGVSMKPTLTDEQQLLVRYGDDAKIGDVIVIDVRPYKDESNPKSAHVKYAFNPTTEFLIKRLIATEGDKVRCLGEKVEIMYKGTDVWVEHPSEKYVTENSPFPVYEVGENEIFFLGDNRTDSIDSRYQEGAGGSRLDCLYKVEDIFGVVPAWGFEENKFVDFFM